MHRNQKQKGFTLIELLVVLSIIGLLASMFLVGFRFSRERALNAKIVSDMKAMKSALDLYYSDHGYYPAFPEPYSTSSFSSYEPQWDSLLGAALSPYLSKMPKNPTRSDFGGYYFYFNPRLTPSANPWCIYDATHAARITNGYYLQAVIVGGSLPPAAPNNPLTTQDNGFNSYYIDYYGGDYQSITRAEAISSCR